MLPKLVQCLIFFLTVFKFGFSETSNSHLNLCSLEPLDSKAGFFDSDTGLRFFWNLCSSKINLENFCNDTSAAVCVYKVDPVSKEAVIRASNAGKAGQLLPVYQAPGHFSLTLGGETSCTRDVNSSTNYSTKFDFFCNDNEKEESPQQSVLLMKQHDLCNFNFFWSTSLACPLTENPDNSKECLLQVPDFDQKLNLKALRDEKFFQVDSNDKSRHFQLNICDSVKSGSCPEGSSLCEVDSKSTFIEPIMQHSNTNISSYYDKTTLEVVLDYESSHHSASFRISCDLSAVRPHITLKDVKTVGAVELYNFKVKSSQVCLFPPSPCFIKDGNKTYDLTSLVTSTKNWVAYSTHPGQETKKYFLSVCKPLSPAAVTHNCPGVQTSVCQSNTDSKASVSLASAEKTSLTLNTEDQSLILTYGDGSACNSKLNYSVMIMFICHEVEKGPTLMEVVDDCSYVFEWRTPVACPTGGNVIQTGDKCQVRDSTFGHVFDFGHLHNSSHDYQIHLDSGASYDINVCGSSQSKCEAATDVAVCKRNKDSQSSVAAFTKTETLTFSDGQLALDYSGDICQGDQPFHTKILLKCDHKADKGQPEFVSEGPCQVYFVWKTSFACPPFDEIECKVSDKKGSVYDLSGLSLPDDNYEIHTNGKTKILINVCRSLVRHVDYDCPYRAAGCAATIDRANSHKWTFENIGQVQQGPSFDDKGRLVIEYKTGGICKELNSAESHLSTKIVFRCQPGLIESSPEFIEQLGCTYIFFWQTDYACPTTDKNFESDGSNCRIHHPRTGQLIDLNEIHLEKDDIYSTNYDHEYYVYNLCAPLIQKDASLSACGPESGACHVDRFGRYSNIGDFNTTLYWNEEELTLRYVTKNATAENRNETVIRFRCMSGTNFTFVGLSGKRGHVTYLDVYTVLACEHSVFCEAKPRHGLENAISMFSMMDYFENINMTYKDETYFFSVCKPLVSQPGLECKSEDAICAATKDPKHGWVKEKSFGMPWERPMINSDGDIELQYVNGSVCEENPIKKYQSKITFKCKEKEFPGIPVFDEATSKDCNKNFIWETDEACRKEPEAVPDNCWVTNTRNHRKIDLRDIQNRPDKSPFEVETTDFKYFLQPCPHLQSPCNATVCMQDKHSVNKSLIALGEFGHGIFYADDFESTWIHVYNSSTVCQGNTNYSSEIHFKCDPVTDKNDANYNKPVLLEDFPCFPIFLWKTPVMCGQYLKDSSDSSTPAHQKSTKSPLAGGLIFFAIVVVIGLVLMFVLRKPENRIRFNEGMSRVVTTTSACATSIFGRCRRKDDQDSILGSSVNVHAFGAMNEVEDDDMIIA